MLPKHPASFTRVAPGCPVPDILRGAIWAIGNFDGVHRGHKSLIREAKAIGAKRQVPCAVMTFSPHPKAFLDPDRAPFRLSGEEEQTRLLKNLGVNGIWMRRFDAGLAAMNAQDFLERIMAGEAGAGGIVIGADFRFGKGREGDADYIGKWCASREMGFSAVPAILEGGAPVSSSRIRERLVQGDVAGAKLLLGHSWFVCREVIHGAKRGRDLGYPTLNMRLDPDCGLRHGIYAVRAMCNGRFMNGVASFGRRPTFDNGAPLLETFLFDFDEQVYGETIPIAFEAFLRPEQAFANVEDLVRQMKQDEREAVQALSSLITELYPLL